eukprot:7572889-Alexandrium_andersonii.AAC.1
MQRHRALALAMPFRALRCARGSAQGLRIRWRGSWATRPLLPGRSPLQSKHPSVALASIRGREQPVAWRMRALGKTGYVAPYREGCSGPLGRPCWRFWRT